MKKLFLLFAVILIAGSLSFYAQAPLPFSESFDGPDMPAGWTAETGHTSPIFTITSTNNAGGVPNELRAGWAGYDGISRCFTPVLDTSGTDFVDVSFHQFYDDYGSGAVVKVQYSTNGVDWVDTGWAISSGDGSYGPSIESIDVPATGDTLWIAWVVEGDHYQINYWFIDDVVIAPTIMDGPDAAVFSEHIWFEPPGGMPGDTIMLWARVYNIGSEDVTGFVVNFYYSLIPGEDLQLVHSFDMSGETITPGLYWTFGVSWVTDPGMMPADYIITVEVTDVEPFDANLANNIAWAELGLPVVLGHFTASGVGNKVNISWMTMSEVDNFGFNLYRLKAEKISPFLSFTPVKINTDTIPGQGTSSTPHLYSFTDYVKNKSNLIYILESVSTYGETEEFRTRLQWVF